MRRFYACAEDPGENNSPLQRDENAVVEYPKAGSRDPAFMKTSEARPQVCFACLLGTGGSPVPTIHLFFQGGESHCEMHTLLLHYM